MIDEPAFQPPDLRFSTQACWWALPKRGHGRAGGKSYRSEKTIHELFLTQTTADTARTVCLIAGLHDVHRLLVRWYLGHLARKTG